MSARARRFLLLVAWLACAGRAIAVAPEIKDGGIALEGDIRVASKRGEGSTFLVELPKLHSAGAPPPSG